MLVTALLLCAANAACADNLPPASPTSLSTTNPSVGQRWWAEDGVSACGPPAAYRANGVVVRLGSCAGALIIPPALVRVSVATELDVHITTAPNSSGANAAILVLPQSSDPSILKLIAVADNGSTAVFQAEAPGTVFLTTTALCAEIGRGTIVRQCPVLEVDIASGESEGQSTSFPRSGRGNFSALQTLTSVSRQPH